MAHYCRLTLGALLAIVFSRTAWAISCYRCTSKDTFQCAESLSSNTDLVAESCDDIHMAQYCVKATGTYEGTLGTQRFCSAIDLGNYCEYVKREGDTLEYRSCVYTCGSNGCNHGPRTIPNPYLLALTSIFAMLHIARLMRQ